MGSRWPRNTPDARWRAGLRRLVIAIPILVASQAGAAAADAVLQPDWVLLAEAPLTAPVPRPHPDRLTAGPAADVAAPPPIPVEPPMLGALPTPDLLFSSAHRRLVARDVEGATRIARAMPDPTGALVIDWLVATDGTTGADADRVAAAIARLGGWPGQALMQIRFEQAVLRADPDARTIVSTIGDRTPAMETTVLALARALAATGRAEDATALVRPFWRDRTFSEATEAAVLAEFAAALSPDDHHWRMSQLLYQGLNDEALRVARLLGADFVRIAEAFAAVNEGRSSAAGLLEAVPSRARGDAAYQYARLRHTVRTGSMTAAAALLRAAPQDAATLVDPDAWAAQRRAVGWSLVTRGDGRTAYEVLSQHAAIDRMEIAEIEFLAGWVALRLLDDPDRAAPHFTMIAASSTLPLSQSRAAYWLGRAHDEAGRSDAAEASYRAAAAYPTTYYGQLALARLGATDLPVAPLPTIDDAVRAAFAANTFVKATGWLAAFDRDDEVALLARFLGDTLASPAELTLLAGILAVRGDHQLALQVAKLGANRGLPVDAVAFPIGAIPAEIRSDRVEMALIYAIARQESSFDIGIVNSLGARGLMQLRPDAAREAARALGIVYSQERLATDPGYNALIGGAYLRILLDRYRGNVVLAIAAYNAGLGRVDDWLVAYGDPRQPGVDPIDWIERIPFAETRNYVQRVLENLSVYRARLGDPRLRIATDLGLAR